MRNIASASAKPRWSNNTRLPPSGLRPTPKAISVSIHWGGPPTQCQPRRSGWAESTIRRSHVIGASGNDTLTTWPTSDGTSALVLHQPARPCSVVSASKTVAGSAATSNCMSVDPVPVVSEPRRREISTRGDAGSRFGSWVGAYVDNLKVLLIAELSLRTPSSGTRSSTGGYTPMCGQRRSLVAGRRHGWPDQATQDSRVLL